MYLMVSAVKLQKKIKYFYQRSQPYKSGVLGGKIMA